MKMSVNLNVNNGYKLNVLANFDNSIKEVRFFPNNTVLTSSTGTTTPFTLEDNTETQCCFKWMDVNDIIHTSGNLVITTKIFNIQDLIDNSNDIISPFDESISIQGSYCQVDKDNYFCQTGKLNLSSQSKVTFSANSNDIKNVILTLYNSNFTATYNSNTLLAPGIYYLVISNGDDNITGGYVDLKVEVVPVMEEPFASATLVTLTSGSTLNLTGSSTLDTADTGIAYKFTVDGNKCHNLKSSNVTFGGTAGVYGVALFFDDGTGRIIQLPTDGAFDTYIAPGTYYLVFYSYDYDSDKNKCVGNFSFDITLGSELEISGFDTLYSNGTDNLYVYAGQLFDNSLTKADPNSTAKLYPNNIDYSDQDRIGDVGIYQYFAIITSADGLTKVSTGINRVITTEVKYSNPTIAIDPTVLSNNTQLFINNYLSTYNDAGYMISGTQNAIVTIKNLTKGTTLGVVDLSVDGSFTITDSSAGDEIEFNAVFALFRGDARGMSYGTTVTLT